MENKLTSETFALPVAADSLTWSFGSITLGMLRDNAPETLLVERRDMEQSNPFAYLNMLYMMGIRNKADMTDFDPYYETGYITFTQAAASHAIELDKSPYEFTRDDIYFAFSDLTQERKHPEWKEVFKKYDVEVDPMHPMSAAILLEKKGVPEIERLLSEIEIHTARHFRKMVTHEEPIKKILEDVARLKIGDQEMKAYAYGLTDAWQLHQAHLFLRRINGMYKPCDPEKYDY